MDEAFRFVASIINCFRRRHVLETTPEADLIAEIKRRRTINRLAKEVESEVDAEVAKL